MPDIPDDIWHAANVACTAAPEYTAYLHERVARAILAERERCARVCEAAAEQFLSPEYATGQPLSSFAERFACDTCAEGIRSGV